MASPAVSLKIRKFRRRFGITAPRVVVRTHVSWHWYAAGGALVALVVLMIVGLALQRGDAGAMETELESLRLQVRSLDEELLRYRATAGTERNAVQMERSTQQRLLDRVRAGEVVAQRDLHRRQPHPAWRRQRRVLRHGDRHEHRWRHQAGHRLRRRAGLRGAPGSAADRVVDHRNAR